MKLTENTPDGIYLYRDMYIYFSENLCVIKCDKKDLHDFVLSYRDNPNQDSMKYRTKKLWLMNMPERNYYEVTYIYSIDKIDEWSLEFL